MTALEQCLIARTVFRWAVLNQLMSWHEHNALMRVVIYRQRRALQCEGKETFTTHKKARICSNRHARVHAVVIYRCENCGHFHITLPKTGHRRAKDRMRDHLLAKDAEYNDAS